MHQLLGIVKGGQPVKAVVRNFGDAQMRLARIAGGALRYLLLGQHYEQRCLAYLGQAYDSGFHELAFSRQLGSTCEPGRGLLLDMNDS
jgi:hypothetical protein